MLTRMLRRTYTGFSYLLYGRTLEGKTEQDERVQDRNYRNLLLSGLWFGPVEGGIYNYLPVFLARLGASPSQVSLLTSGPAVLGILSFIPGGAFAERFTDQVKVVVRAAVVGRLVYPLIVLLPLFLPPEAIPTAAIILWSVGSIANAVHVPAWTGVMQRAVQPRRRAQLNGSRWALMGMFSAVSLLSFGFLLDRTSFPAGYQIVFMISFAAGLLNMYYFGKVRVPPFVPDRRISAVSPPLLARLRAFMLPFVESRPFVRFVLATFGYRLALAMPVGLFSVYWVNNLHATDSWIGLRGTVGYAALVLGYWFWGRVANRLGHRRILASCAIGHAFYPVSTALAPTMQWLLPAAALWGFTAGGIDIGLFDMLLAACPERRQPSFAGVANVLTSIAIAVGPLVGAALAQEVGIRTALFVIGALQIVGTSLFRLLPSREQEGLA